jgi:hypothetical protein
VRCAGGVAEELSKEVCDVVPMLLYMEGDEDEGGEEAEEEAGADATESAVQPEPTAADGDRHVRPCPDFTLTDHRLLSSPCFTLACAHFARPYGTKRTPDHCA